MSALRKIRKEVLSLSQAELSALVGVSQGTVSKWENGELSPSLDELSKLRTEAIARGIKWDDGWLFGCRPSTPGEAA